MVVETSLTPSSAAALYVEFSLDHTFLALFMCANYL